MNLLIANVFLLILISAILTKPADSEMSHIPSDAAWIIFTGAVFGAAKNAAMYVVKVGGRSSNILNVYAKDVISSFGNPTSYARIDSPHGKVDFYHINVNKAITGVKDPHIPISEITAHFAGYTGQVLEFLNKIGPKVQVIVVLVDTAEVAEEYLNGNTKEALRKLITMLSTYAGATVGASAGLAAGNYVFPGVGGLVGGIVGGAFGGVIGGAVGRYYDVDDDGMIVKHLDLRRHI